MRKIGIIFLVFVLLVISGCKPSTAQSETADAFNPPESMGQETFAPEDTMPDSVLPNATLPDVVVTPGEMPAPPESDYQIPPQPGMEIGSE